MKTKNQNVYYVPHVRIKEDFKNIVIDLKAGSEYPIADIDDTMIPYKKDEIGIMVSDKMFCQHTTVPINQVELFVKIIVPKFKLGDIVKKSGSKNNTFRIYEYCLLQGKIWYRDGWSIATGCESGVHEECLEYIGNNDIDISGIHYYDKLVSEKYPEHYKYVMSNY